MQLREYKTPLKDREKSLAYQAKRRSELGNAEYLRQHRAQRKKWVAGKKASLTPGEWRVWQKRNTRKAHTSTNLKSRLCKKARMRGRERGLEATIRASDLYWPVRCPVLGTMLDYTEPQGDRGWAVLPENMPSLDRVDNSKGYAPGNVCVISHRANHLKGMATAAELKAVLAYMELHNGTI